MWNFLGDLVQGAGAIFGQHQANRTNVRLAREQMAFQERMSSTAAQRSREDFEKAGLNPALAYGTTASSPVGASARVEDVIGPGISSARASQMQRAQIDALKYQNNLTLQKMAESSSQTEANLEQARLALANRKAVDQRIQFERELQPYKVQTEALSNLYQEYVNKSAKVQGEYDERFGTLSRGVKDVTGAAGGIGLIGQRILREMFNQPLPRR